MTPFSVPRGGLLYTMIVLGGGFLLPSSRVLGVCPGGMDMDEIDTCINRSPVPAMVLKAINQAYSWSKSNRQACDVTS